MCNQKYTEKALTTQCIGTIRWQAPEAFQNPPVWSLAADIYSLGMVFYELMTGKIPFEGETDRVPEKIRNGDRPPLPEAARKVGSVCRLLLDCFT